ncbi:VOC family protein [Actinoalloteichus caeruleus]|uniref:VOC family protein n=1 Tax=Actinoalloteichus cyanogriseus TaxID=2893586 RepID=UPI003AAA699A
MSQGPRYREGMPCWVDLLTDDRDAAAEFYGTLFGWDFAVGDPAAGLYTFCQVDGQSVAGIARRAADGATEAVWTTYLAVDDAAGAATRIRAAGGVATEPLELAGHATLLTASDSAGAVFGVWQAGDFPGAQLVDEPGSLVWNELVVSDADRALDFYHRVFGHGARTTPDSDYSVLELDERPVGGVLPMSAVEEPVAALGPHWAVYFGVESTEDTIAHARRLGATTADGPNDTPYGRVATLRDPQGAFFGVVDARDAAPSPAGG